MKIAVLGPLKRPLYTDTTVSRLRIIAELITGLQKKGHVITYFGPGDSTFPGVLIEAVSEVSLQQLPVAENPFYQHTAYLTLQLQKIIEKSSAFDIIHNHMYPEFLLFPFARFIKTPIISTIHSQMTEEMKKILQSFSENNAVAISQAAAKASGREINVVYNGIDTSFYTIDPNSSPSYLLFVGRISKAKDKSGKFIDPKGVLTAIEIAEKVKMPLKIVGNVEDISFFNDQIKPHLSEKIQFVGQPNAEQTLTRDEMKKLYQGAIALVNPINWEEPFGLVMTEAMACGAPVIAFNRGSVSEIIDDGKTGFIIEPGNNTPNSSAYVNREVGRVITKKGIDGFCDAITLVNRLDRQKSRERVLNYFSTEKMVQGYENIYKLLVKSDPPHQRTLSEK